MSDITDEKKERALLEAYMPDGVPSAEVRRDYLAHRLPALTNEAYSAYLVDHPGEHDELYKVFDAEAVPLTEADRMVFTEIEREMLGFGVGENPKSAAAKLIEMLERLKLRPGLAFQGGWQFADVRKSIEVDCIVDSDAAGHVIATHFAEELLRQSQLEVLRLANPRHKAEELIQETLGLAREIVQDNAIPLGTTEEPTFATEFFGAVALVLARAAALLKSPDDSIDSEAADEFESIAVWAKRARLKFPEHDSWQGTEAHLAVLEQRLKSLSAAFSSAEMLLRKRDGGMG